METLFIHISSGKGPAECCLAVALSLREIVREAKQENIECVVLERIPGQENGTLLSAIVKIKGIGAEKFANSWKGTVLWIVQSPYRKYYKRKNWFISIETSTENQADEWKESDVQFKTMRASGPGGQHVNKTESAVRAIHVPSGIQTVCRESRSQVQNRTLALERLKQQFDEVNSRTIVSNKIEKWQQHSELERGNAVRTYTGTAFKRS